MSRFASILLLAALAGVPAMAQGQSNTSDTSGERQGSMNGMDMSSHHSGPMTKGMGHMMGMHMMSATITAIGTKTGMIDASAEGISLKLHFPPDALSGLKAGDKITLHMGFTKP